MIHILHSTFGVPIELVSALNPSEEMMAPALPDAADIPCADARNRVGKTSAGYRYVVLWSNRDVSTYADIEQRARLTRSPQS